MLTFVGVGPGDPELITLKAARVLREADAIAYTDSGRGEGTALHIAADFIGEKPRCAVHIPMKGSRTEWKAAHQEAANTLLSLLERYEKVAYPVLGDPGIYASSSYLMRLIAPVHPCRVIPGISSINAGAAALGIPLVEQRETLTVLDAFQPGDALPDGTVVVMKCGRCLDALRKAASGRPGYAVRNLGMENAWTGCLEELSDEYAYFTMAIILPKDAE